MRRSRPRDVSLERLLPRASSVPEQTLFYSIEPIGVFAHGAHYWNGETRDSSDEGIAVLQLGLFLAVERRPRGVPSIDRARHCDDDRVRKDNWPERQRVRANGRHA